MKKIRKLFQFKYGMVMPALLIMLVVVIFPLCFSVKTSLYYYVLSKPYSRPFIGLKNYIDVLKNPQLYNSLRVTIIYSFGAVTLEFLIGFSLAYLIFKINHCKNLILTVLMAPMMIPTIAVGLIWKMLLHTDLGIINYLMKLIGITVQPWLGQTSTALPTLILIDVWQWASYLMLLVYAGMLSLPTEPFEADTIDGASEIQKVFVLTIPMMKDVIIVSVLFRIIDAIKAYDLLYVLTGGGPGISTETFSYFIYKLGFIQLNLGQACAVSLLYVFLVAFLTGKLFNRIKKTYTY